MAYEDFPDHLHRLVDNTVEVGGLLDIHTTLTGGTPGRHHKAEILNKSTLVLMVACWEAYIEDLAAASFSFMLAHANQPTIFPNNVLTEASKPLIKDNDCRKVWELSGDGWKNILKSHKDEILNRYVGKLNTPRPKQINEMFEKLIGYKNLSSNWKWRGMSNSTAKTWLEEIITIRGEIAHTVKASTYVKKNYVGSILKFVHRLAAISSNRVGRFVEERTGEAPWGYYNFGKTG